MNLAQEKTCSLSARDRYDILTFAISAADDNGFVNSFIFERAMYCYAAIILTEDDMKDDIRARVSENIIDAWDYLVQNNIIQELRDRYADDLDYLAKEGGVWLDEYDTYATSARGILSLVETFTGSAVSDAVNALRATAEESGVANVINIAQDWGMTRDALKESREEKEWEEKDPESLL